MRYQMLTGQLPRGCFVPPPMAAPGLDCRLDRITDRALQTDPAARYACAAEFAAVIEIRVRQDA